MHLVSLQQNPCIQGQVESAACMFYFSLLREYCSEIRCSEKQLIFVMYTRSQDLGYCRTMCKIVLKGVTLSILKLFVMIQDPSSFKNNHAHVQMWERQFNNTARMPGTSADGHREIPGPQITPGIDYCIEIDIVIFQGSFVECRVLAKSLASLQWRKIRETASIDPFVLSSHLCFNRDCSGHST